MGKSAMQKRADSAVLSVLNFWNGFLFWAFCANFRRSHVYFGASFSKANITLDLIFLTFECLPLMWSAKPLLNSADGKGKVNKVRWKLSEPRKLVAINLRNCSN